MKFKSYEAAKKYVHRLNLKSSTDWREFCRSGRRPKDIPSKPFKTYQDEWKGWADFLGKGTKE